jgi:hypothetical protein
MKRKRSAEELVKKSVPRASAPSWYDRLTLADKAYVRAVVKAIKEEPNCHVYPVAETLIEELGLTTKTKAVVIKLKEMLKDGPKNTVRTRA